MNPNIHYLIKKILGTGKKAENSTHKLGGVSQ